MRRKKLRCGSIHPSASTPHQPQDAANRSYFQVSGSTFGRDTTENFHFISFFNFPIATLFGRGAGDMNKKVVMEGELRRKRKAVVKSFFFCHIFNLLLRFLDKLFTNHEEFFMIFSLLESDNSTTTGRCVALLIRRDASRHPFSHRTRPKLTARLCEKSICDSNPIRMSFIGICVFILKLPFFLFSFTLLHNNKQIFLSNYREFVFVSFLFPLRGAKKTSESL